MQDSSAKPNIVVFLADDLGIGEVGAWGQHDILTPHIDRLAREGLRLTEFRSGAAVCAPSRCALMLGLHTGHCRIDDNDVDYLRAADLTLAERLHAIGYVSGLFGKWGLSWEDQPESWPNAQGFQAFFGYRDQRHAQNYFPETLLRNNSAVRTRNTVPNPSPVGAGRATTRLDYSPTLIRDAAFDFVRTNQSRPFFLYWATTLPHVNESALGNPDGGYEVPDLGRYADAAWPLSKRSYAAQVSRLDQDLGDLRALLDSLNLSRRTLIVFLSDNGASGRGRGTGPRSEITGRWFNGTMNYRGFKGDLYDGGLRVPAVAHWPGRIEAGGQSTIPVDLADLHATLIDVAGEPGGSGIDGRSFRSTLLGTGTPVLRPYQVWFSRDQDAAAILEGRWKGVWDGETLELYDLAGDPSETTDVVAAHPEVASRFEAIRRTEDRRLPHPIRRQLPGVR